jgi:hypothetical protein
MPCPAKREQDTRTSRNGIDVPSAMARQAAAKTSITSGASRPSGMVSASAPRRNRSAAEPRVAAV